MGPSKDFSIWIRISPASGNTCAISSSRSRSLLVTMTATFTSKRERQSCGELRMKSAKFKCRFRESSTLTSYPKKCKIRSGGVLDSCNIHGGKLSNYTLHECGCHVGLFTLCSVAVERGFV